MVVKDEFDVVNILHILIHAECETSFCILKKTPTSLTVATAFRFIAGCPTDDVSLMCF